MIQRIQTVYLIMSIIAISFMFLFPFAELFSNDGYIYIFNFKGVDSTGKLDPEMQINTIPLILLMFAIIIISLIAIFLFKNRIKQIRLVIFNILLLIGLGFFSWYYLSNFSKIAEGTNNYKITMVLPAISIVFLYLAYKAIRKDENLIRSADRIR